jgi:hypothetical protein
MESSLEQLKLRFSAQENIIHLHSRRIFVYALLSGSGPEIQPNQPTNFITPVPALGVV